jgi:CRISPR-associated endonuclease/helicase Cas3
MPHDPQLTGDDFPAFFRAIHQHRPFPWQEQLVHRVLAEGWPVAIDVPTGLGKTSVLDVAVFTLAATAGQPRQERRAQLRTFFVINRRLVVDDFYQHMRRLRDHLAEAHDVPVLRQVAERLRLLAGLPDGEASLQVYRLRGGIAGDSGWTVRPDVPALVVSTVDQFGSRLLFRGYGVTPGQWPIHAALTGTDALLIVDEAHLSEPLLQTVTGVGRAQHRAARVAPRGLQVVRMSATLAPRAERVHGISKRDWQDETARRRLQARKLLRLHELEEKADGPRGLVRSLAELADKAAERPGVQLVAVVVNRVATARAVASRLGLEKPPGGAQADRRVVLLTGRMREFDRMRVLGTHLEAIRAGRDRAGDHGTLFLVATQTIEVGADLDFDALMTEAAPLDALLQRLGRLDRLGELGEALGATEAHVVFSPALHGRRQEDKGKGRRRTGDPVYGDKTAATWEVLTALQQRHGELDLGIKGQRVLPDGDQRAQLCSVRADAPVLLPAHLDAWMRTSPAPACEPAIAPFLHGTGDTSADVQIVWRAELDRDADPQTWAAQLRVAPPRAHEAVPVTIDAARAWLSRGAPHDLTDLDGTPVGEGARSKDAGRDAAGPRRAIRVGGRGSTAGPAWLEPSSIQPGDTIVCSSAEGGCDEFGWNPRGASAVLDVGDLMVDPRRGPRLRLHAATLASVLGTDPRVELDAMVAELDAQRRGLADGTVEGNLAGPVELALRKLARMAASTGSYPAARLQEVLRSLLETGKDAWIVAVDPTDTMVVSARPRRRQLDALLIEDEEDIASLTRPVALDEHGDGVGEQARQLAMDVGLAWPLTQAVALAGQLHDIGKAGRRFQCWLYYGDELQRIAGGRLLAKSGMDPHDPRSRAARLQAGLPDGFRHEAVSAALVRKAQDAGAILHDGRLDRLVVHLIGTHHGHGRPCFQPIDDPTPEPTRYEVGGASQEAWSTELQGPLDDDWVETFFQLSRTYGPWGLAYLETLVRSADVECSRRGG